FTQSNYGIVTKMGFWLMPRPPVYKPFLVKYPHEEDIVKAMDTIRPLRMNQIIANAGTVSNALWEIAVSHRRADLWEGDGQIPDAVVQRVAREQGYGAWNVYAALYGTEEQVEVNWRMVKGAFSASGGEVLTEADMPPGDPLWQYRKDMMSGTLSMQEFGLYNWRGGGGSTWFAPVAQAMGSETLQQMRLAKQITARHGLDYVALFIIGWRDMHHIVDLLYDKTDPAQRGATHACYGELLHEFAQRGYGVYRTSIAFMDQVAELYGPVKHEVNQALKRALDPNGILAPGKSGIY
ncbi:MAG TPA: FAD-linked oxidase C-terminal domain-containing protein, partial [Gammaproteobacteria bacterium]